MPQADTLKIFETLRKGFEEKQSTLIAEAIEAALESSEKELVTKEYLRAELVATKADLRTEIASVKAEIIKWMFIFWAGHTVAVVGIVFTVVKYLK